MSEKTFLAFGVLSHPNNIQRRAAIRSTWGTSCWVDNSSVLIRFVIGRLQPAAELPHLLPLLCAEHDERDDEQSPPDDRVTCSSST